MKTKFLISIITFSLLSAFAFAGDEVTEAKFKVFGNCTECKARIEGALKINEVKSATWDVKKKILSVAYQSSAITLDSLQKRVASVGHDTEKYKATDEVYNELPGCCLYRGESTKH
ncbi:MAG: heavy-metal-associated domain-containing protein [Bacteroidota bacterium]|nr:heavy-metal-associated domain-containing protein [Bacteroidota bacterium]